MFLNIKEFEELLENNNFPFLIKKHEKEKFLKKYEKEILINKRKEEEYEFELEFDKFYASKRPRQGKFGFYAPDGKEKTIIRNQLKEILMKKFLKLDYFTNNDFNKIEVSIKAYKPFAKSKTKFEKIMGYLNIFGLKDKPDVDNIAKIYLDACNGLLWKDDASISKLTVEKFITLEEKSKIIINIKYY